METIKLVYPVEGGDLIEAGEASSQMKLTLKKLGLPQDVIRRASICMYAVVFNYPAGDTLVSNPQYQAADYYQMCYSYGTLFLFHYHCK